MNGRLNRRGFTLAELLLVVAIIAILVAIAVPTFSGATDRAGEGVCLANRRSAAAMVTVAAITSDSFDATLTEGMTWAEVSNRITAIGQSTFTENICPQGGAITLVLGSSYAFNCSIHGSYADGSGSNQPTPPDSSNQPDSSTPPDSSTQPDGSNLPDGSIQPEEPVYSEWSATKWYEMNDICRYKNALYKCKQAHSANGNLKHNPTATIGTLWERYYPEQ